MSRRRRYSRERNGNGRNGNGYHAREGDVFTLARILSHPLGAVLSAVVMIGAAAVTWNQLGLWKPASTDYVDGKVAVVSHKIDMVDSSTLQNRIETISAAKARDLGEKSDLEMKQKLAANNKVDPDYARMLQVRLSFLNDQIAGLDRQMSALQEAINRKNAEAAR